MLGWPAYGAPFAYPGPYDPAMTQVQERDVLKGQAEYFEGARCGRCAYLCPGEW
jgi:hypothetical protein